MAYMSQEKKAQIAPVVKSILKKHGLKGSLSVHNHSTLVLTIKSGKVDFGDAKGVNHHWLENSFQGKALKVLTELKQAMMVGNHDNSDAMTDYFDVGWYIDIKLGKWNKPYVLEK